MRKVLASLAVTALVLAPAQVQAQDEGDVAAYAALLFTPVGGLAPIATPAMMGADQVGLGYSFRYGKITGDDAPNNFGAGVSYGHNVGTFGITAGYLSPAQDGVDGHLMLGGNYSRNLTNVAMSANAALNIGLDVGLGWASREEGGIDATMLAGQLGVPVSTVAGSGSWRFVPYVQPGLGWGRISADDASESGTQFMVAAGLGIMDGTRGLGFNVGFQKIFQDDGENVIGLGFSWHPRR